MQDSIWPEEADREASDSFASGGDDPDVSLSGLSRDELRRTMGDLFLEKVREASMLPAKWHPNKTLKYRIVLFCLCLGADGLADRKQPAQGRDTTIKSG